MEHAMENSLKGQLLMAMPMLADPNFSESVTIICEHTNSGAMGVIVDRVNAFISAKDIFQELNIPCLDRAADIPVHHGGPVHMDEIFVLHGPPFQWDGCLIVSPAIALSNTFDILTAIAEGIGPESFLITLGCAGWGEGQLESELKQNVWVNCPASKDIVFEVPIEMRWKMAMKKLGVDPDLLSNMPGHA